MKSEADVKKRVKNIITRDDCTWQYMPVQSGFGVQGVPDFIGCAGGLLFAIETKFGKNTLSAWQTIQITKIQEAGGKVWVVSERNVEQFHTEFLQFMEVAKARQVLSA